MLVYSDLFQDFKDAFLNKFITFFSLLSSDFSDQNDFTVALHEIQSAKLAQTRVSYLFSILLSGITYFRDRYMLSAAYNIVQIAIITQSIIYLSITIITTPLITKASGIKLKYIKSINL